MADKTTQILKEFRETVENSLIRMMPTAPNFPTAELATADRESRLKAIEKAANRITFAFSEALSQQQQEAYQEVLDLDIMKDEGEVEYAYMDNIGTGQWITLEGDRKARNKFRAELRQAIAERRGKV